MIKKARLKLANKLLAEEVVVVVVVGVGDVQSSVIVPDPLSVTTVSPSWVCSSGEPLSTGSLI